MKCNKKWCQFRFHCAVCNIDSDSFTQSCKENRQYEMMSISASISPRCQLWYLHQQAPNNAYNYLPNSLVTAVGYNEIGNTMMLLSSPILLRRHVRGHLWNNRHPIYASGTMLTVPLSMTLRKRQQANAGNYFVNCGFTKPSVMIFGTTGTQQPVSYTHLRAHETA